METPNIQLVGLPAPMRHALQALALLAARPGRPLGLAGIARRFGLPEAALAKSFQSLARAGLLVSRRGPRGGYCLGREPGAISLAAVIEALGGRDRRHGRCLLEERACSPGGACALHSAAVEADARMLRALRALTLTDLQVHPRSRSHAAGTKGPSGAGRSPAS